MRKTVTGLRAWLVQRASAKFMLCYMAFLVAHFVVDPPHSYTAWRGWMTSSFVSITTAVFFAALLAHTWVGVRDVIMDYVHPVAVRVCLLASLALALAATGAWVLRILWLPHS